MDFKQFYKTINFDIDNEIRTVYQATQGDTKSRGLIVDLIVGGVKTPVTTEKMTFFALKPDGTRVMTVGVKEGTGFRIDFTNQTFAVPGDLLCTLVLSGTNGEKIADKKFKMTVDSSLEDGAIISEDERGILDRAFELAEDIVPRMEALATLGERLDSTNAQMMETDQRIDNLIATPVPTGEIIAEEIIDARDGEVSVGAKIRSVDAQLAQNAKDKQDYKRLFDLIPKNNEKIIFKKHDDKVCYVYVHHHGDVYMQHKFGRYDGNFNEATPLAKGSGDTWFCDFVRPVSLTQIIARTFNEEMGDFFYFGADWRVAGTYFVSRNAKDYVEFKFYGSTLSLHYHADHAGIMDVSINGKSSLCDQIPLTDGKALIDTYEATGKSITKVVAKNLPVKWHTCRVSVTGDKNAASTDAIIYLRRWIYETPIFATDSQYFSTIMETQLPTTYAADSRRSVEMAISATYDGVKYWMGTEHRNTYLTAPIKIIIDNNEYSISALTANQWMPCKKVEFHQEFNGFVGANDLISVKMSNIYTSDGMVNNWDLTWLLSCTVSNSYSSMYSSSATKFKQGGVVETIDTATIPVSSDIGDAKTDHMIGWNDEGLVLYIEALDYFSNTYDYKKTNEGSFIKRIREDYTKAYIPKFKGAVLAGDKWKNSTFYSVKYYRDFGRIVSE